jgi:hypothetical protein
MPIAPNRGGFPGEVGGTSGGQSSPGGGGTGSGASAGTGGGASAPSGSVPIIAVPGPGQGAARSFGSDMYQVVRLTPDRTEYGPTIFVNASDEVTIAPLAANVGVVFIATGGNSDAKFPPRLQLSAVANPIDVSVSTLKQIGVYAANVGDGVLIILKRR